MTFTRDDLDTRLKLLEPSFVDLDSTKFGARRDQGYKMALAEYQKELLDRDDPYIRRSTLTESTAPSTGTQKINTAIGDVYRIALLSTADRIADDTIMLNQSTTVYKHVPRMDLDAIQAGGTGETIIAFYENKGEIVLYVKDATFTAPGDVHYNYYVQLGTPSTGSDTLDIRPEDFSSIVERTLAFMRSA